MKKVEAYRRYIRQILEHYAQFKPAYGDVDVVKVNGGEVTVPAGEVFVMGDNRAASKDSRDFGTVPLQDVVGKARQVWFSRAEGTIRWERLGKVL